MYWTVVTVSFILCFLTVDSQTPGIECPSNHYSNDRVGCIPCGKCLAGTCGAKTGECVEGGCKEGYQGNKCDTECSKGRYGRNCGRSCNTNCLNNDCNSMTGTCNGCLLGYTGQFCGQECSPGTFGWKCEGRCIDCLDNECDPVLGHCVSCPSGYIGEKCTIECPNGTYGMNCNNTCPHCSGLQCNKTTGECLDGCSRGYHGDKCESEYMEYKNAFISVSVLVGVLAIVVIVLIICLVRRRRLRRNSEQPIFELERKQRRLDGYTSYPINGDKGDKSYNKSDNLSPPDSSSPTKKRRTFGSFLAKRDSTDTAMSKVEPENSQLPDDDVTEGRQSGYIEVMAKPEVMSDDGYLLVDRKGFSEEDYENVSHLKIKQPVTVGQEIYEIPVDTNTGVPPNSQPETQPLYENFGFRGRH